MFSRMMGFARKVDFRYHCLCIDKRYCDTAEKAAIRLGRQMRDVLRRVKAKEI